MSSVTPPTAINRTTGGPLRRTRRGRARCSLWALPLYEDLTRHPGNLHQLRAFFLAPHRPEHPWGVAVDTVAGQLAIFRSRLARALGRATIDAGATDADGAGPRGRSPRLVTALGVALRRRDQVAALLAAIGAGRDRRRRLLGPDDPRRALRLPGGLDLGARLPGLGGDRDAVPAPRRSAAARVARRAGDRRPAARRSPLRFGGDTADGPRSRPAARGRGRRA